MMYDGGIVVSLIILFFLIYTLLILLMTETILDSKWIKLYAVSSFLTYISKEVI